MPAVVIPGLQYRDAARAIDWLVAAFGFTRHLVVPGPDGTIAHAELVLGDGMIMLSTAAHDGIDGSLAPLLRLPAEVGGCTQTIYVRVDDVDAVYATAQAHGATIVLPLTAKHYGGRDFTCRDLEGHLWAFGTYDPW